MNFFTALDYLVPVDNKDGAFPPWADAVLLGPTPVNLAANDYSWVPSEQAKPSPCFNPAAPQSLREARLIKQWKREDPWNR